MTRRIRRDLSNKQIRKIVQEQFKESSERSHHKHKSSLKKPLYYFLGILLLGALVFILYRDVDMKAIFSGSGSPSTAATPAPEKLQAKSNTPTSAQQVEKADTNIRRSDRTKPVKQKIQIEVLNGCGVAGIAKTTTNFCRKNDLDVVEMTNYVNFAVKHSQVISRNGKKDEALRIAKILGIEQRYVVVKPDRNKQLSASVVLGKDYKNLKPFKK